jgi:hypothetical protein
LFTKRISAMTVTVEALIKELETVQDKQAKVVITRNGGIYDIDKIVTPGKDEDYVTLAVEGSENDNAPVLGVQGAPANTEDTDDDQDGDDEE